MQRRSLVQAALIGMGCVLGLFALIYLPVVLAWSDRVRFSQVSNTVPGDVGATVYVRYNRVMKLAPSIYRSLLSLHGTLSGCDAMNEYRNDGEIYQAFGPFDRIRVHIPP